MKNGLITIFIVVVWTVAAYADRGDAQKGMQLFQRHHYHDAAQLMYAQLAAAPGEERLIIRRNFGMACLANAQFYDRLYQATMPMQVEYLNRLVQADDQRKTYTSRLAQLYLGKALLANGRPKKAIPTLTAFLETPQVDELERLEAKIALGEAYHNDGQKDRAAVTWSEVPATIPHVAILLAAAYQRTGKNVEAFMPRIEQAATALLNAGDPIPVQYASALLDIFGRRKMVSKGFDILAHTRLETFAREEAIGTHKVLRFYEAELLHHLSGFYNQAAIDALNSARKSPDPRIAVTAAFLTGEAFALSKRMDDAARTMDELLSGISPEAITHRARVRQLAYSRQGPSRTPDNKTLDALLDQYNNVDQISDIIVLCSQLRIDCPETIKRATQLWQQAKGHPPSGLGMALGRYFQTRQDHTQALHYLEAVRDKSRKNRIETNPPAMLADLAWAYYRNRQFSEALEIYFSMSKQFPVVRQIQVALQGIYSMEQQSAGNVHIF